MSARETDFYFTYLSFGRTKTYKYNIFKMHIHPIHPNLILNCGHRSSIENYVKKCSSYF